MAIPTITRRTGIASKPIVKAVEPAEVEVEEEEYVPEVNAAEAEEEIPEVEPDKVKPRVSASAAPAQKKFEPRKVTLNVGSTPKSADKSTALVPERRKVKINKVSTKKEEKIPQYGERATKEFAMKIVQARLREGIQGFEDIDLNTATQIWGLFEDVFKTIVDSYSYSFGGFLFRHEDKGYVFHEPAQAIKTDDAAETVYYTSAYHQIKAVKIINQFKRTCKIENNVFAAYKKDENNELVIDKDLTPQIKDQYKAHIARKFEDLPKEVDKQERRSQKLEARLKLK